MDSHFNCNYFSLSFEKHFTAFLDSNRDALSRSYIIAQTRTWPPLLLSHCPSLRPLRRSRAYATCAMTSENYISLMAWYTDTVIGMTRASVQIGHPSL